MDAESMAAGGGVVGAIGVIVGGIVKLVGSRTERDASAQSAADEWQELHRECKRETETLRARLDAQDARLVSLERILLEHAHCAPRIAHLEREQAVARGMLSDLMRNASTPPSGLYVPDDVRAALAQEDHDHG